MKKTHTSRAIRSLFLAPLAAALALTSCKKEDTASPIAPAAVTFQLRATNPSVVTGRVEGGTLTWTGARAEASMIKFEAKKAGAEIELKSNVQRSLDLFAPVPSIGSIAIPAGSYDEVEFVAYLAPASGNPALELTGTFSNNGVSTPVTFRASEAIQLKGEKHNVVISDTAGYDAITALNLSLASAGLTSASLSGAVRTGNTILISSSVNAGLYATIVNNLRNLHDEAEFHHH
ncbi:MAG: hypothetical protein JWP27_1506 [Flaviaesturariibacter sp.]|nr:hypothetical protein [Flaviaesturariibacter sp.]